MKVMQGRAESEVFLCSAPLVPRAGFRAPHRYSKFDSPAHVFYHGSSYIF